MCVGLSATWCWVGGSQRTHAGAEHMVEALLCPRGLLDLFCNKIWSLTQVSRKLLPVAEVYGTVPRPNDSSLPTPTLSDSSSVSAGFPASHQRLKFLYSILKLVSFSIQHQTLCTKLLYSLWCLEEAQTNLMSPCM